MNRAGIWLCAGFIVWASAFVALYAMLSVGCRFGWHEMPLVAGVSLQRAQLVAILLVHVAAGACVVAVLARQRREAGEAARFLHRAACAAAVAGLAATLFSFFGVFYLTACY